MASIDKRGAGWRVRWRDPDGVARSRQCPTHAAARELLRDVEGALALGRRWVPAVRPGAPTLDEVMADYLGRLARTKSRATVANRRSQLERFRGWLSQRVRGARLDPKMLTRGRLEEWDASMVASYEPSSREQALNIVMGFWRWAFDDEEVGEHFDRPRKLEVPGRVAKPVRAPTWAHMDEAIAACPHVPTKRAMVLMRCLGWRVGQVQRLEWQDVDLEAGTFQLRGELGKSRAEKIGRVVPIAKVLVDELAGWGVREGRIVNVSLVQVHKHMLRAWLASGAPAEVFEKKTGHAFRRGFRTELKAAGVDSEAIEFYCGRVIGVRELYTDPRALALAELVAAIPPFGSCVPGVSRLTARKTKIG